MPLLQTSGNVTADGYGGGVAAVPNYIEDVFSTYLYTGTGVNRTITNGIDLSTKGGLTWIKSRDFADNHNLFDTNRGAGKYLVANATNAEATDNTRLSAFTSSGFSLGTNGAVNGGDFLYSSWTFRKQPKFFDVVTYTGTGSNRTISHSLGSVPACIMVKRTDTTGAWQVYHSSLANTEYLVLNTTAAKATGATRWNSTTPTSTVFSLGTDATVNASGGTYVAYIFASNSGGFGLTGTDNVISCGSYTGNGSATGPTVTLGYEPQWVLVKSSTVVGSHWYLMDTMRGMAQTVCNELYANLDAAEITQSKTIIPTATGFDVATTDAYINNNGSTYIYIAIRRGPMKVPTSGTSVYTANNAGSGVQFTAGFPPDMVLSNDRTGSSTANGSRLVGPSLYLETNTTSAETSRANAFFWNDPTNKFTNDIQSFSWVFQRAPSFHDVVCYTGTGVANTAFNHNLTVTPELMIFKPRSAATAPNWRVWSPIDATNFNLLALSTNGAASSSAYSSSNVFPAAPTATTFTVGGSGSIQLNESGQTFVAYLFATCAGVSKVGSYTGNGSTQTINCGFTGGARFVLIKRTDSTGDWYVYDTARGMTVLTDPYLLLNSTAAESATLGSVTTVSTGFAVNASILAAINTNAASYIFLAIA